MGRENISHLNARLSSFDGLCEIGNYGSTIENWF